MTVPELVTKAAMRAFSWVITKTHLAEMGSPCRTRMSCTMSKIGSRLFTIAMYHLYHVVPGNTKFYWYRLS